MEAVVVDTNVLVRFLIDEDVAQARRAVELFRSSVIFLPETVLLETEWVLRSIYELGRREVAAGFLSVLKLRNVQVERRAVLLGVIEAYAKGFDFADALHYAGAEGMEVKTFDRKFVNRGKKEGWRVSLV